MRADSKLVRDQALLEHFISWNKKILSSPEFKNGEMQASNSPGHGVKFKEHLLHKYEIDNAGI